MEAETEPLSGVEIEALLRQMQPPIKPEDLFERIPRLKAFVRGLDRVYSLSVLAGLQMLPEFQANTVRLDWAMRLVAAVAEGKRRLKRADWNRFLNALLGQAGITRLEDPIEDFFSELVLTQRGEFRVLLSQWEGAAHYTEQLIEAFESLPDGRPKTQILDSAYALLKLADALAERLNLPRRAMGGGEPAKPLRLPSQAKLNGLPHLVRFSWTEVKSIIGDPLLLLPFVLPVDGESASIAGQPPGNSTVDFQPLIASSDGIAVVAPGAITTAVRGHLVDTAVKLRVARRLQQGLNKCNTTLLRTAGMGDMTGAADMPIGDLLVRQHIFESSAGRYVHILLAADGFATWGEHGFSAISEYNEQVAQAISESIRFAKKSVQDRDGFKEGLTILVFGGWGQGVSLKLALPDDIRGWQVEFLAPTDIATFPGLDDVKIPDLWRIWRLARIVEGMGFELHNPSGFLNLLQWWRESDHALIPEHHLDMVPPCQIYFGSNLLVKSREEAAHAIDRRAIPHPDGSLRKVMRLDPRTSFSALRDVYASMRELEHGELLGAVVGDRGPIWVSRDTKKSRSRDEFENWQTILQWLDEVLVAFENQFPALSSRPVLISIEIEWPDRELLFSITEREELAESITFIANDDKLTATLKISRAWHRGLHNPINHAERYLVVQLLCCVAQLRGIGASRFEIEQFVGSAISDEVRFRHAFVVERPLEIMSAGGLSIEDFRPVPKTSAALVKCCSALSVAGMQPGQTMAGLEECISFLGELHSSLLSSLCAAVAQYQREGLVIAALDRYQSALADERSWAMTARAVQAIHGSDIDRVASFERRAQCNAIIRGCSIIAEIAASQASTNDGFAVGKDDLDDLLAAALQIFSIADFVPALRAGHILPNLSISPTGHVLFDLKFHDAVLASTVRVLHSKDRREQSDAYARLYEQRTQSDTPPEADQKLIDALGAEFGVPAAVFGELSYLLADLAVEQRKPTFLIRRSKLVGWLRTREIEGDPDFESLIDRLILPSRPSWNHFPVGAESRDFDLARFDRGFSLIGRPLLAITGDDDPLLAIAPAIVERSARHNIAGASVGGLQGNFWTSAKMRSFVGSAGQRAGMQFNEEVAAAVQACGLDAKPSVKPSACLNQKATDELKYLGDIDVLAITADKRHAWVIEAKDLKMCRTLSESVRRLSDYRGLPLPGGKPDNLLRHLNRVAYVRANAEALAKHYKLPTVPIVRGLVIVDSPQPMTFMPPNDTPDAKFVMLSEISDLDWSV